MPPGWALHRGGIPSHEHILHPSLQQRSQFRVAHDNVELLLTDGGEDAIGHHFGLHAGLQGLEHGLDARQRLRRQGPGRRVPQLSRPAIDAVLTMWPSVPWDSMMGTNTRRPWMTPHRLTPNTHSQSALVLSQGVTPAPTPALLNNRWTAPNASIVRRARFSTSDSSIDCLWRSSPPGWRRQTSSIAPRGRSTGFTTAVDWAHLRRARGPILRVIRIGLTLQPHFGEPVTLSGFDGQVPTR